MDDFLTTRIALFQTIHPTFTPKKPCQPTIHPAPTPPAFPPLKQILAATPAESDLGKTASGGCARGGRYLRHRVPTRGGSGRQRAGRAGRRRWRRRTRRWQNCGLSCGISSRFCAAGRIGRNTMSSALVHYGLPQSGDTPDADRGGRGGVSSCRDRGRGSGGGGGRV